MAFVPVLMVAGAAISAMGAIAQADAAKKSASYNAQMRTNEAKSALDQATQDANQSRIRSQHAMGSISAGYGAAGVATDEGSPLDVLAMSASNAKYDEQTIKYRANVRATGYYNEATLSRYGAKVAEGQGYMNAASSLLTGAGRAYGYNARLNNDTTPTRDSTLSELNYRN